MDDHVSIISIAIIAVPVLLFIGTLVIIILSCILRKKSWMNFSQTMAVCCSFCVGAGIVLFWTTCPPWIAEPLCYSGDTFTNFETSSFSMHQFGFCFLFSIIVTSTLVCCCMISRAKDSNEDEDEDECEEIN